MNKIKLFTSACLIFLFAASIYAQNFAVLLYKDASNPDGIPADWPAQTYDIGSSTDTSKYGAKFKLMTKAQLDKQFSDNAAAKEAWNKDNIVDETPVTAYSEDDVVVKLQELKDSGKTSIDDALKEFKK